MANQTENAENGDKTKKKPDKQFREGAYAASVWTKEGKNKEGQAYKFHSIQLQRGYTDKEGKWVNSTSINSFDLPKVRKLLDEIENWTKTA